MTIGVVKRDTRSSDYSSHVCMCMHVCTYVFGYAPSEVEKAKAQLGPGGAQQVGIQSV